MYAPVLIYKCLLGHSFSSHASDVVSSPVHGSPPFDGFGEAQLRLLDLDPTPQLAEQ